MRYTVNVRAIIAREFSVEVEADSRIVALRLAADEDEWQSADDDAPLGDDKDEVLEIRVLGAEVADDENPG